MWRLKIGKETANGDDPYLYSTNDYVGRQIWEFDPHAAVTPEELARVQAARLDFYNNRHRVKPNSDSLWRMQFLKEKNFNQTIDALRIGEEITIEHTTVALKRALHFFSALQSSDGHWPAENAGPLFFLPPLVICLYITGHLNTILSYEHRKEILRYIYYHQNEDGGWGLHIEGPSTMFCTTLNYICIRILRDRHTDDDDNTLTHASSPARALHWIHDHGTVTHIPSWGKTWLSILGVYDWSGCNPMPPEFWLLPSFLPMHPAKMWCYCRLVYLPMSYLYGKRFVGPITPLVLQLREELYSQPYKTINWWKSRHLCAPEDLYYPHPLIQDLIWDSLYLVTEPLLTRWPAKDLVRKKALEQLILPMEFGGLGITDLFFRNVSLLIKRIWRLSAGEDSLWADVLRRRYSWCSIGDLRRSDMTSPSPMMRDIIKLCDKDPRILKVLQSGGRHILGDGKRIRLWWDNWISSHPLACMYPDLYRIAMHKTATVAESGNQVGGSWEWAVSWDRELTSPEAARWDMVLSYFPTDSEDRSDKLQWERETNRVFTVASFYDALIWDRFPGMIKPSYGDVWQPEVPFRICFFVWLTLKDCVVTREFLVRRHLLAVELSVCALCASDQESIHHLLLHCPRSEKVWQHVWRWLGVTSCVPMTVQDAWSAWIGVLPRSCGTARKRWCLLQYALWWSIWLARNEVVFKQGSFETDAVIRQGFALWFYWLKSADPHFPYTATDISISSSWLLGNM